MLGDSASASAQRGSARRFAAAATLGSLTTGLAAAALLRRERRGASRELARMQALAAEAQPAIYDGETGLYASWYFALRIQDEMERCERYGQLFLLMAVEAAPGLPGERRQALVDCMKASFRATDLVAYLGDQRFAVLLPNTGLSARAAIEQRMVSRLAENETTIGYALYPGGGTDLSELLQSAENESQGAVSEFQNDEDEDGLAAAA